MHARGLVNHLWCSASVNENDSGFFLQPQQSFKLSCMIIGM